MTDDISKVDNPWREFIENCIGGSNYFRSSEYYQLLADLDRLYRLEAATTPAEVDGVEVDRFDPGMCSIAGEYGGMDRNDGGDYVLYDDYATLARQLAEAKAGMERRGDDMIVPMNLLDEINATSAAWQTRAEQAESQLAEATRRLGEVDGLVGKWRELGGNDSLDVYYADGLRACADELEQLTKEPTK